MEICKRRRFDEDSIFLSRGRVFRKAGEKSRKSVFRRTLSFDSQTTNSTSTSSTTSTTVRPNVVINPVTEADSDGDDSGRDIDFNNVEL